MFKICYLVGSTVVNLTKIQFTDTGQLNTKFCSIGKYKKFESLELAEAVVTLIEIGNGEPNLQIEEC